MNDPDKYQLDKALYLLHGDFQTFESIADYALRVTARSILARPRIFLSKVTLKDSTAQKDLWGPMNQSTNIIFPGYT